MKTKTTIIDDLLAAQAGSLTDRKSLDRLKEFGLIDVNLIPYGRDALRLEVTLTETGIRFLGKNVR
jgi:hypothetical protein